MTKYSIAFTDIDGTLVGPDSRLTPTTIDCVQKLCNRNIPFVLVSGRTPAGIQPILNELRVRIPIVCYSGAYVLDENGNELHCDGFNREEALAIEAFIKADGSAAVCNFYSRQRWYTPEPDSKEIAYEVRAVRAKPQFGTVAENITDTDVVNKFMYIGEPEEILRLEACVKEAFPQHHICRSLPIYLEINSGSTGKATGLRVISDRLDIPMEETVACGDNYNDLDMLEAAGLAVVMGNAPEDIRSMPGAYLTQDNAHDGLAAALTDLFALDAS